MLTRRCLTGSLALFFAAAASVMGQTPDLGGSNSFESALRNRNLQGVRRGFERDPLLALSHDLQPYLHGALRDDAGPLAEMLLARGARCDVFAAAWLGRVDRLRTLLDANPALVGEQTDDRDTPLHFAAGRGQVDVVRLLLDRKADANARNREGNTPLHRAAAGGRLEAARVLLDHGANANAANGDGDTPLQVLVRAVFPHEGCQPQLPAGAECADPCGVASLLLDRGAEVPHLLGTQLLQIMSKSTCWEFGDILLAADTRDDIFQAAFLGRRDRVAYFSATKPDTVAAKGPGGLTALHWAAARGHLDVVKLLLECGAFEKVDRPVDVISLAAIGSHVPTLRALTGRLPAASRQAILDAAVWQAVRFGRAKSLEFLLRHGANGEHLVRSTTLLHTAAEVGGASVLRVLNDLGPDLGCPDLDGWNPLHRAALAGRADSARWLLRHGVPPERHDEHGLTALHLAVQFDVAPDRSEDCPDGRGAAKREVIRALLEGGADANAAGSPRLSPLHLAVANRLEDVARLLVEHRADPNARDDNGQTPLHYALSGRRNNPDAADDTAEAVWERNDKLRDGAPLVALLLAHGARPNLPDREGQTPLHGAAALGDRRILRQLVAAGGDVNMRDFKNRTPLHLAAWHPGGTDVADLLLDRGTDLEARTLNGHTPLYSAVNAGNVALAAFLLAKGANVEANNDVGQRPLHLACGRGNEEMVKLLLKAKASVNARDNEGGTPLTYADGRFRDAIADLLKAAGGSE